MNSLVSMRLPLALAFSVALLLSGCARGPVHPEQLTYPPLTFQVPDVERLELANGIRLYLKEDHELPLVSMTAMVGAGSIGVPADRTGMGGLFATTLRTGGTQKRSPQEQEQILARMAAELSASTDTYATTVGMSLRAADLGEGLELLVDVLRRPAFDPRRLELARNQAIEGVRRRDDNPSSVASRLLRETVYGNHPLGRSPSVSSLQAVKRDDLIAFHQRYFQPNNLWLAVSGDFDREALMALLEEHFGTWEGRPVEPQAVPPVENAPPAAVLVADKQLPQTTILMGGLGIEKSNPDLYAVRVMNYILGGGGFNSRLMREIRSNRGLAYSVYSYFEVGRRLPGLFVAGAETKSASTVEVASLIQELMAGLEDESIAGEELRLAKESLINSFVFAFDDTHGVVTQTMRLDFYDYPPDYLATYRDKIAAVDAEDVRRAAAEYLPTAGPVVVLVGDRGAFDQEPAALGLPVHRAALSE